MKLPAAPPAESVVALVDTREQLPFALEPLRVQDHTLQTGDYSILGMENLVAVERKSLADLVSCVGPNRDRFQRELERLAAFPHRLLAVEGSWEQIRAGDWRSNIKPASVEGSLYAWMADFQLPVLLQPRPELEKAVARWLYICYRRRYRDLRKLLRETAAPPSGTSAPATGTR